MIPLTMKQRESSAFYYMLALNYRNEKQIMKRKAKDLREYFDIVVTQEMALGLVAHNRDLDRQQQSFFR